MSYSNPDAYYDAIDANPADACEECGCTDDSVADYYALTGFFRNKLLLCETHRTEKAEQAQEDN